MIYANQIAYLKIACTLSAQLHCFTASVTHFTDFQRTASVPFISSFGVYFEERSCLRLACFQRLAHLFLLTGLSTESEQNWISAGKNHFWTRKKSLSFMPIHFLLGMNFTHEKQYSSLIKFSFHTGADRSDSLFFNFS